jgi:hypothetical protein
MDERHEHEQYFFLPETTAHLADFAARFDHPCCLCAPTVGVALVELEVETRLLEIDERFAPIQGFLRYDIYRPRPLDETFGLILCDPPFVKVGLDQLFAAVRMLARGDFQQPLLICHPRKRAADLIGTFARFGLVATGYVPRYQTVQAGSDDIEVYGNLSPELHAELARGPRTSP